MSNLGKLEEITDLREVWPNEETDFTPWLAENIEILGEKIGIDITVRETESNVGSFSLDILASETGTDRKVIVENQIEKTDHRHLGQLITYAAGKSASIIIWVVKHAREEHRAAVEWLNNHTDDEIRFFLCEIKIYKIGNSIPAVTFEVIERPNDWSKVVKNDTREQSWYSYWENFLSYVFDDNAQSEFAKSFSRRKPSKDSSLHLSMGSSDYKLILSQLNKRGVLTVEFYINGNKDLYDSLFEKKECIEKEIGFGLDWKRLDDKKDSRVVLKSEFDLSDDTTQAERFKWFATVCPIMKKVFLKYIKQ